MAKKIALIIGGCGHRDGAEITEAVSLIISLSEWNAQTQAFAPQIEFHPINHLTGTQDDRSLRNSLVEASRIMRGKVQDLTQLHSKDFDGIAIAGGTGMATVVSDWANQGSKCHVHPELQRVIEEFHRDGKPILAVCIAPALVARVLGMRHGGKSRIVVTLGDATQDVQELLKTGAEHEICPSDDFISDRDTKIISTPAYMNKATPAQIFHGIRMACKELVELA